MPTTKPPQPEEILKKYTPTLKLLVAALLEGAKHARAYADWMDESVDRTLSPAHVRKGAKRFLAKQEKDSVSVNDEEVEFEAEYLPNLGLSVSVDRIKFRILKSDNGSLPVPGPSKKRQQFYAQQGSLFPIDKAGASKDLPRANLVLHWVPNDEYNLTRVSLAYPIAGKLTRLSVKSEWDEVIWRSGAKLATGTQAEASADELDIHLDKPEEETGTGG